MRIPRILIIAGSDSGGGAGIQADIKTVTMLGGHAMTAITAITAQNTLGVSAVHPIPADMVIEQIDMVASDIGVDAVKIGMIGSPETALAVAARLEALTSPRHSGESWNPTSSSPDQEKRDSSFRWNDVNRIPIVFDPVMVATSGAALADEATIAAFERLMRVATLITPNAPELEVLAGRPIRILADAEDAALDLAARTGALVLAKGGHLDTPALNDLLATPQGHVTRWQSERIDTRHTHGTGCTLASAVATGLARGLSPADSVTAARDYVRAALLAAPGFGAGHGPMGHALGKNHSAFEIRRNE